MGGRVETYTKPTHSAANTSASMTDDYCYYYYYYCYYYYDFYNYIFSKKNKKRLMTYFDCRDYIILG